MKSENYRVQDLEKVWIQLTNARNLPSPQLFKDQLNAISRMLVWDDQNQSDIFEFACEVKMFDTLTQIFGKSKEKDIINAILGFFTMLLTNISRQPSINYLLSHPSLASLQLTKFGNMGNEVADYYINFLKVLSRKITTTNLQLFFNKRYSSFPILSQAVRFFNHPENLVRTTSRNILLTIAKLKDPRIDAFMSGFPFVCYYIHECNFLKEYWAIVDTILHSEQDNRYELDHLDTLIQDHEEILIFVDDLLGLGQAGVAERFVDAMLNQCLSPLAIAIDSQQQEGFSIKIVLFFLTVLLKTFSNPLVANTLSIVIFGKYYPRQLAEILFQPIQKLLSYDKKWKFKGFWDSHEDKILQYCSEIYHYDGRKKEQMESSLVESISKKIDTFSVFGVTNNFYQRQIQKIEQIFAIPIITSKESLQRTNGSKVICELMKAINSQKPIDLSQCEINPLGQGIQSYLTSKDDSLVMLTLNLFTTFLQNRSISPSVAQYCKMSLKPIINDFQSIIRIQKTIIHCLKLFQVDPPCYRICTYSQAQDLAKRMLTLYGTPNLPLSKDIIDALKLSLKLSIHRISPYLYGGRQWEKHLQIYQDIIKNINKRRAKTLRTFGLLPEEEIFDKNVSLNAFVYQQFPREFEQQIARDFWIYVLIRDLFLQAQNKHEFAKFSHPEKESQHCKYEEGKVINDLTEETIAAEYKASLMDKFSYCEIILMSGYFSIIKDNRVELKIDYQEISVIEDKSDPRKLLIQYENGLVWIGLRDARTLMQLKKHFEESRSVMLRYRLAQMVKEIESFLAVC